jgi:cyclophilin family peptidyl-prolyl cis-trans isomerase
MRYLNVIKPSLLLLFLILITGCSKDEETDTPCGSPFTIDLGSDHILPEGETLTLDATIPEATYQWSTGETTPSIVVDTNGIYWVAVSTCYGTESDTIQISLSYPTIKMVTAYGDIGFWLYHQTPLHRNNFLELANNGFYEGLIFHRVIENFVIQGGDPDGTGYGGPGYTIAAEIIAGITHQFGAVGAARLGDDVNPERESNGSQFYIVSDSNGEPGLNGNYTVFGQVFYGLEVVSSISQVEVDGNDRPLEDVIMQMVSVEYFTAEQLQTQFGFQIPD